MKNFKGIVFGALRRIGAYIGTDMVYVATSGFWLNLNVLIITLLSLALSIAFANLLPQNVYGTYQYFLSLSTVLGAFTLTGMNYAVTTSVATGHEGVLRDSVRTQLAWSVIPFAGGLAFAFYYFLHGNVVLGIGLLVVTICTPFINTFNTYSAYLTGKKKFREGFIYATAINIVYYLSIFLGVLYVRQALPLLIINLGINALALLGAYMHAIKRFPPNEVRDPAALSFGKHLSAMNAFTTIVRQADALLVFHFLGPVVLAVYTFASTVPERFGGLFKFLFFASLPKFAEQTQSAISKTLVRKFIQVTLAGVVVAGLYAAFAPIIFDVLFPRYLSAIPYTQVYALVIIGSSSNIALSALTAKKLRSRLYVFNIMSPLFQLSALVSLLLLYGLWGIITARVLSSIFDSVLAGSLALFTKKEQLTSER